VKVTQIELSQTLTITQILKAHHAYLFKILYLVTAVNEKVNDLIIAIIPKI
jgi:hypothetical protein